MPGPRGSGNRTTTAGRSFRSVATIKLDPSVVGNHLLLGYTLPSSEPPQDALANSRKPARLDPRDTVSLCMIGYALQKTGHSDQAIQYYARALRIKPGDDMAHTLMADVDLK